jgi:hypothetical protein
LTFDPERILRTFEDEGVVYVVVGGLAAVLRGSSLLTSDVDIVPERGPDNLDRLARALRRLGAKLRTSDQPVEVHLDGPFLQAMPLMLNLSTEYGDVDLTFEPAGPRRGYAEWRSDATEMEIEDGLVVQVASLDAVIDSKRAAGRPKDERDLPYLESLREQIQQGY